MPDQPLLSRVIARADVFGGKSIIRERHISVGVILRLLIQGESIESILLDYPELQREDIPACVAYAHRVVAKDRLDEILVAP